MANKLNKLTKVNDSFTVNRYDNGWMVEVSGRDKKRRLEKRQDSLQH